MDQTIMTEGLERALADGEIPLEEIPRIDLYMDQIITIFEERLAQNKRTPDDKLLTKTMIHNYSKEKILQPLAGKKYSREHILQILMIYQMKQVLSIQDIKKTMQGSWAAGGLKSEEEETDIQLVEVYQRFLEEKKAIRKSVKALVRRHIGDKTEMSGRGERLLAILELSAMSYYFKKIAEELIDQEL